MKWYALLPILLLTSCNKLFDTHPYSVHFHGERSINAKQIAIIEQNLQGKDTVRVAFISDTHGWFSSTCTSLVLSCDLYIRSKFIDSDVSLSDILGLSLGLKLQIL